MRFWRIELVTLFHGWFSAPLPPQPELGGDFRPLAEAIIIGEVTLLALVLLYRWFHGG